MKPKKRKKKKELIESGLYTPGRNRFGQRAKTKLVILERNTAFQQMMDCIQSLEENKNMEFAFDMSCFIGHDDERDELMDRVQVLTALKAKMLGVSYSEWLCDAS